MMKSVIFVLMLTFSGLIVMADEATPSQLNATLQAQLEKLPFPEDVSAKSSRFASIRKLLEISSGAKKVLSSDRLESHKAYLQARKTYILAAKATDNKVNDLLDQTVKLMYQAVTLASPKQMLDVKKERDYQHQLSSVNALLEALTRIAIEKNNVEETTQLKATISELLMSADTQLKNNHFDKAKEIIDQAYLLTKAGIENMRSGDVLVRELKFESLAEEYAYELDRNDTHQMLIKLLVEKKMAGKSDSYKKRINDTVAKAKAIREQAEKLATNDDFKGAIAALEKSTKELVRAIRMGGVFIPG